jgi:hypothetical protein
MTLFWCRLYFLCFRDLYCLCLRGKVTTQWPLPTLCLQGKVTTRWSLPTLTVQVSRSVSGGCYMLWKEYSLCLQDGDSKDRQYSIHVQSSITHKQNIHQYWITITLWNLLEQSPLKFISVFVICICVLKSQLANCVCNFVTLSHSCGSILMNTGVSLDIKEELLARFSIAVSEV